MKDFGLYMIITSPIASPCEIARVAVSRGVKYLQLREKNLSDRELLSLARELRALTLGTQTKFIVNDRVDIAYLSAADGVHLGQADVNIEDARALLGKDKIVGLSTHSLAQAREAIAKRPDYIGFGPVYKTPTKAVPDAVVGCELLRQVIDFASVPVVAIGGITLENLPCVLASGAKNVCAVRPFMQTKDVEAEVDKFIEALKG
ncbi:MAG: thiamine phosphate synthase [Rikenellaceae bacterium]